MRFVIIGPGAVGGLLGALLARSGKRTLLLARPAHVDSLRASGLQIQSVTLGTLTVAPPVESIDGVRPEQGDILLLCVKGFDTPSTLAAAAEVFDPSTTPVFCFQNGVRNEEVATAYFRQVHGGFVNLSATCLTPGKLEHTGGLLLGVGLWPEGRDQVDEETAGCLQVAGFSAGVHADIRAVKWGKCMINTNNAVLALTGLTLRQALAQPLARQLMADVLAEGARCLQAAGIQTQTGGLRRSIPEMITDLRGGAQVVPFMESEGGSSADGPTRSSTWQDLTLGRGRTEVDAFNGEVERLGEKWRVATPLNSWLRREIGRRAVAGEPPGGLTPDDIRRAAGVASSP